VDYEVNILGVNGLVRVTSAQDADLALISKRGGRLEGWRGDTAPCELFTTKYETRPSHPLPPCLTVARSRQKS
jgi:hypothetical protein